MLSGFQKAYLSTASPSELSINLLQSFELKELLEDDNRGSCDQPRDCPCDKLSPSLASRPSPMTGALWAKP